MAILLTIKISFFTVQNNCYRLTKKVPIFAKNLKKVIVIANKHMQKSFTCL